MRENMYKIFRVVKGEVIDTNVYVKTLADANIVIAEMGASEYSAIEMPTPIDGKEAINRLKGKFEHDRKSNKK